MKSSAEVMRCVAGVSGAVDSRSTTVCSSHISRRGFPRGQPLNMRDSALTAISPTVSCRGRTLEIVGESNSQSSSSLSTPRTEIWFGIESRARLQASMTSSAVVSQAAMTAAGFGRAVSHALREAWTSWSKVLDCSLRFSSSRAKAAARICEPKRAESSKSEEVLAAETAYGGVVVLDECHVCWRLWIVCSEHDNGGVGGNCAFRDGVVGVLVGYDAVVAAKPDRVQDVRFKRLL